MEGKYERGDVAETIHIKVRRLDLLPLVVGKVSQLVQFTEKTVRFGDSPNLPDPAFNKLLVHAVRLYTRQNAGQPEGQLQKISLISSHHFNEFKNFIS